MLDLKRYEGPYGIPVYHQRMPEMVKSASLAWLMLTGAADDTLVGSPGLYHWFEHVPFRGTRKYPRGREDITLPMAEIGGKAGAWTNKEATCFYTNLPMREWRHGLSVITDLLSQPLLKEKDISAERDIIRQEIVKSNSIASSYIYNHKSDLIYGAHPFGHPVLGTEDTLESMNASIMEKAYREGYDRSRLVFFAVGDIDIAEVLHELHRVAESLPAHGLSRRESPADYGSLPKWKAGDTTRVPMKFDSHVAHMLFPHPSNASMEENYIRGVLLWNIFMWGDAASPLMRIIREERHLVYQAHVINDFVHGGGYFGFQAQAEKSNIDAIIQSYRDILTDASAYSPERIKKIIKGTVCSVEMQLIDPEEYVDQAIDFLLMTGSVMSREEYCNIIRGLTVDKAQELVSSLRPEDAHVIIYEGEG